MAKRTLAQHVVMVRPGTNVVQIVGTWTVASIGVQNCFERVFQTPGTMATVGREILDEKMAEFVSEMAKHPDFTTRIISGRDGRGQIRVEERA